MLTCPRDSTELKESLYEGVHLDRCATCHGTWLEPGELEAIETEHRKKHEWEASRTENTLAEAVDMRRQADEAPLACPVCGATMTRHEAAMASQVMVDVCPEGHGTWADGGELRRLEVFIERLHRDDAGSGVLGWIRRAMGL